MHPFVVHFSTDFWAVLLLVGLGGTLAVLWTVARAYEDERKVHDLKTRVAELRASYARRIADMHARENGHVDDGEVLIVDEAPPETPAKAA